MDLDPKALALFKEGYDKILEGIRQLGYDTNDENFVDTAARAAKGLHQLIHDQKHVRTEVEALLAKTFPAKYTESWDDTALGKVMATNLFDGGADVVYHAAGRCGLGVIAAAREAEGKLAIGVDSDQDDEAKGKVLTSMIKRVDNAVYSTIKDTQEGKFTGGTTVYDLKSGGVSLSDFRNTKDKLGTDGMKKLDEAAAKIKDGSYKVPATVAEVAEFLKTVKR
ncbi:BMP family ABC transporter substrate-binding protein [bacterium]|nr:MAG: BMP family ABC transporter substrate-binding protein [bacterium]